MFETVEELNEKLQKTGYFIEPTMTQVAFLAAKMQRRSCWKGRPAVGRRNWRWPLRMRRALTWNGSNATKG